MMETTVMAQRGKRKPGKPLSGWSLVVVSLLVATPFSVSLACLLAPMLPKHETSLWEVIAFPLVGGALIAALEIFWKD